MRRRAIASLNALIPSVGLIALTASCGPANPPAGGPVGPRNVIVFVGDGMGFNHVAASSLYFHGKTNGFAFQRFPVCLAASTFAEGGSYTPSSATNFATLTRGATDSAAAATALATGVKTHNGVIGMDARGVRVSNVLERAESAGRRTGVVSSVPFSHATPAGFATHASSRASYAAIASNMVWGTALDVIMGCGHPDADPKAIPRKPTLLGRFSGLFSRHATPAAPRSIVYDRAAERRHASVGGTNVWLALRAGTAGSDADGDGSSDPWTLIETRGQFRDLARAKQPPGRVIGVPLAASTLQQDRPAVDKTERPFRAPFRPEVPTLAEMTAAALNVLDGDPDGFVLMVEGGAIDWAAHAGRMDRVIEETVGFAQAVDVAIQWVKRHGGWDETLIVVTADHETGYLWGVGSGQTPSGPQWVPVTGAGRRRMPEARWFGSGHTNQLVPLYAKGCGAERFLTRIQGRDPRYGEYVDNTAVADVVFECLAAGASR